MNDRDKAIEAERDHIDAMEDFLDKAKPIRDAIPIVERNLESAKWRERQLLSMSGEVAEHILPGLYGSIEANDKQWGITLPDELPKTDMSAMFTSTATATFASTVLYQSMVIVETVSNDPLAQEWASSGKTEYETLQKRQDIADIVSNKLSKLDPTIAEELKEAVDLFYAGTDQSGTALKMRNVLEGLRGKLWMQAKQPREQKLNWTLIAERLSKGQGPNSVETKQLLETENNYSSLWERLTKVAKEHESENTIDLQSLYTEWVDYLDIVLNLIKI